MNLIIIVLIFVSFIILLLILLIIFTIWATIFGGVPYLGSTRESVTHAIKLSNVKPKELAVDLGSGDGRIVISFCKAGAIAYGYEMNPFFVLLSKFNIWRAGLSGKAHIIWGNFFKQDLSSFDIIISFCIPYSTNKLERKLKRELKKNSRVISLSFPFKQWKYTHKLGSAYLYIKDS